MRGAFARAAAGLLAAAAALVTAGSCALLDPSPLAVLTWSPHQERLSTVSGVVIQVRFSRPVDITLTEEAFSITADDAQLPGRVSWPDTATLVFTPDEPLRDYVVYAMHVSMQAEDTQGRDLQSAFNHTFTTRTDSTRPSVLSCSPADHASIVDPLSLLVVTFSKAMDPASLYSAFSLSPSVTGFSAVSPDGRVFTFTPTQQLQWQTRYALTISKEAMDTQRNTPGSDFTTHFVVGADTTPPSVAGAQTTDARITLVADGAGGSVTAISGWEATDGLRVTFSEPVLTSSALSAVTLSPAASFKVQEVNSLSTTTLTYSFPDRLSRGATYTVFIAAEVQDLQGNRTTGQATYHFIVDGPDTKPPVVAAVCFQTPPVGSGSYTELEAFGPITLPAVATPTDTFFDLYIDHAPGATVDPFVVAQSFSVSTTNGAADVSPFAVEPNPVVSSPAISGPNVTVERVWVHVTNNVSSGQVVVRVSTTLTDSRETALAHELVLPLNDTN